MNTNNQKLDKFKGENKVRSIGGRLRDDFYRFKRYVEYINDNQFKLFYNLGLDDIDLIIKALNSKLYNLCGIFVFKSMRDIKDGKIPKNKFLSQVTIDKLEKLSPEQAEKMWEKETKRKIKETYSKIEREFLKENGILCTEPLGLRRSLELFGKSLFVTPSRLEIDGIKFVDIYKSYIAADESETKKLHEQAAEALNQFFNGIEITQDELSKYFVLEDGRILVRASSVNIQDYSRLGNRASVTIKRKRK